MTQQIRLMSGRDAVKQQASLVDVDVEMKSW